MSKKTITSDTASVHGSSTASTSHLTVADIFRHHGPTFLNAHNVSFEQRKVITDIVTCRTEFRGGFLEECGRCGYRRIVYVSCGNRHCPTCGTMAKARWLKDRQSELLPVPYFHLVFTLPHELNVLALYNRKLMGDLLFQSVSKTLLAFGNNPKNGLGGKPGFIAILHTWDQQLRVHYHLHCLLPAGALSSDGQRWISARSSYLFPVKALSTVFRSIFISLLKKAFTEERLIIPPQSGSTEIVQDFCQVLLSLWAKQWVVYCKPPYGRPEKVLDYLGRYVHRVAISNNRLISLNEETVTFSYRDRTDNDTLKEKTISANEFIRRFLYHVMPKDFMRIRFYGFLANRCKKENLKTIRSLLGVKPPTVQVKQSWQEIMKQITGTDMTRCPCCQNGTMTSIAEIEPLNKGTLSQICTFLKGASCETEVIDSS